MGKYPHVKLSPSTNAKELIPKSALKIFPNLKYASVMELFCPKAVP